MLSKKNKEVIKGILTSLNLHTYDVEKHYENAIHFILKNDIATKELILAKDVYPTLVKSSIEKTYCAIESCMRRSLSRALAVTEAATIKQVLNYKGKKKITTKVLIIMIVNIIRKEEKKRKNAK